MLLAGIMAPAVALAQGDGGVDGMYRAPPASTAVQDGMPAGHTGYSSDPNGNMGVEGRTGKPAQAPPTDAAADAKQVRPGHASQKEAVPSSYASKDGGA
jgi:hypothetical protein